MAMDTTQLYHLKRQQATESGSGTDFYIADTSPFLSYADPSSSSSLWTSGYALQSDGYDQTLHMTSRSNAQISFNISATLLTFLVPSYPSCKATVAINGSSPIDACAEASSSGDVPFSLYNLPTGTHQVTWQAGQLSSTDRVIFWGIDGMREPEPSASTNVTIDDTYTKNGIVDLEWDGAWDLLQPGRAKEGWSETDYLDASFNKTLHVTQKQDAAFRFSGEGTALYLYGMIGPDHGSASVEVDGQIVAPHLNLTSAWLLPYQLLWFTTGMAAGSHNVTLKNLEDKKMALDFVILTTSDSNLSQLGGSSPEFLSTLAGKLVIFLVIPSIACLLIGLAAFCYITRRRDKRRRASRDSSLSLRPNLGFITAPRPGLEKRDSEWSAHASPFGGEMFVAYDLRDSQSNPDRWSNPISPTSLRSMSSGEIPYGGRSTPGQRTMSALPESFTDSPMQRSPDTDASGNTWTRPIRSLLGSSYTRSSRAPSRRQTNLTNLPPYTPGDNGTYLPDNEENRDAPQAYPTAIQEKEAQLEHLRRINAHTSNGASSSTSPRGLTAAPVVAPAERPRPPSTAAPSEIMSVYGQPPSERRDSAMTSFSAPGLPYIYRQQHISSLPTRSEIDEDLGQSPIPSRSPNGRPTPTVDTSFLDRAGPSRPSATSSIAANSAMPLLDSPHRAHVWNSPFQDTSRSGALTHKRSMTAMSTRSAQSEAQSAARPDSDIIPFDTFLSQGPPSSWRP